MAPQQDLYDVLLEQRLFDLVSTPALHDRASMLEMRQSAIKIQTARRRCLHHRCLSLRPPVLHLLCGLKASPIYERGSTKLVSIVAPSGREYPPSVLCLGAASRMQLTCIGLVEWPAFDRMSIAAIVVNCAMLAIEGPPSRAPHTEGGIDSISLAWTLIFSIEIGLRIGGCGAVEYWRENWNKLDIVVVLAGYAPLLYPPLSNYSAIRGVRALRPLRTVSRMPTLRTQVATLVESIPHLVDVLTLVAVILAVFGVFGVQLFKGTLHHRCFVESASGEALQALSAICTLRSDGQQYGCGPQQTCQLVSANPADGTISFDDIFSAWRTIFQCITLEGWTDIMYMHMQAVGPSAALFFIPLILIGSFYVLNLFLAALWRTYLEQQQKALCEEKGSVSRGGRPSSDTPKKARPFGRGFSEALQYNRAAAIIDSDVFNGSITCLILLNTLTMMSERYPMPAWEASALAAGNSITTVIFSAELLLRFYAVGVSSAFTDPFVRFDAVVVLMSVADSVVDGLLHIKTGAGAQVFRAFRILRVLKLMNSWSSMRRLIAGVLASLESLMPLLLLLILVQFVFALLGMQLYGGYFQPSIFDETPRLNFDTIGRAMLSVFVCSTGEGWVAIWRNARHAIGPSCDLFFLTLVVIGDFLLLNLVVTVLLAAFSDIGVDPKAVHRLDEASEGGVGSILREDEEVGEEETNGSPANRFSRLDPHSLHSVLDLDPSDKSLNVFPRSHPLRRTLLGLVTTKSFEKSIAVLVVISTGLSAINSCDVEESSPLANFLLKAEVFVTGIFLLESICKVLAHGLAFTPRAYLLDPWNCFDLAVISISLVAFASGESGVSVLRTLRLLRLLRLVPQFREVVNLVLQALPSCGDVVVIYFLFVAIFGILGVQLFAGKFASCQNAPEFTTRTACEASGQRWANPRFGNFDNIFHASLLLFEMSTMEDWPDVMALGTDVTSIDHAPERDASRSMVLYFVVWIGVGALFLPNLFVGVLVDTFTHMRERELGYGLMTADQAAWTRAMEVVLCQRAVRSNSRPVAAWRSFFFSVATSKAFDMSILLVVFVSLGALAADGYGVAVEQQRMLACLGHACTVLFCLEAAVKVCGFALKGYLADRWNRLDLIVLFVSLFDWVVVGDDRWGSDKADEAEFVRGLRLLRLARVLRVLRMFKWSQPLREMLSLLLLAFPGMLNIFALYILLVAVFACLGMTLFGAVRYGEYLNEDANFCTFPAAALTLFRCATGESWNGIMHDAMAGPEHGCSIAAGDCGTMLAVPYFIGYIILSNLYVLNMLIAFVLQVHDQYQGTADQIQLQHAEIFTDAWARLDPEATGAMPAKHLCNFIHSLPPPFGIDPALYRHGVLSKQVVARYALNLDLVHRGGMEAKFHFHEMLAFLGKDAVCERSSKQHCRLDQGDTLTSLRTLPRASMPWSAVLPSAESRMGAQMRLRLSTRNVQLATAEEKNVHMLVGAHCSAWMIQRAYRAHRVLYGRTQQQRDRRVISEAALSA